MTRYKCTNCQQPYPQEGMPHKCLNCGGVFGIDGGIDYNPKKNIKEEKGLWRFGHSFGLPKETPRLTLGEGDTSLVKAKLFDKEIYFKLEFLNPTGSFKDRLMAPIMSLAVARGVVSAIEDSSGNAGASFAAYAARAGIKGKVFIPCYASGPKKDQIKAYGVDLVPVAGSRSAATEAALKAVNETSQVYASHAYLPHGLPGLATIAYELMEQLAEPPATVMAPVGHGSLLLGIGEGFSALQRAGIIERLPKLVGIQAIKCAPLWAASRSMKKSHEIVEEGETLAEGVRVRNPVQGDALLRLMDEQSGIFVVVDEDEIVAGAGEMARLGFYVEPTSAIVWSAFKQLKDSLAEPIVSILTGSGLKSGLK